MRRLSGLFWIMCIVASAYPARFALLVGNGHGGSFQPLKYVRNDVQGVQSVLSQFCGFNQEDIVTCLDKSPDELNAELNTIQKRLSATEDVFLFYYSGHADHESLLMGNERYPLAELKQRLRVLPSQIRILVFDACQSGSFARYKGGTIAGPFLYAEENKIEGQVVLYSSSANEYSQESDLYKNSIFTFHLLNALRGCADISGDQKVTLAEAYQYSYNQTVSSTIHSSGGVQHPGYQFRIQGEGNVVLTDIAARTCGMVLGKDVSETIIVLNAKKDLVADLVKDKGGKLFIAVNPGSYEIYNNTRNAAYKAKILIHDNTIVTIQQSMFKEIRTIPVYAKGAEKQRALVGISVSGGFVDYSLAPLAAQCNTSFAEYQPYGIQPSFVFPAGVFTGGIGLELLLRNNVLVVGTFDHVTLGDDGEFTGAITSPGDTVVYPMTLKVNNVLECTTVHLGIGYTFEQRILQYLSVRAGIDVVTAKFSSTTTGNNTLYTSTTSHSFVDKGILVLPTAGIALRYMFQAPIAFGAQAHYRFQFNDKELINQTKNSGALRYNFSGISCSLFAVWYVNKHR